jgi:uncharacterized membrane protein YgcG
MLATAETVESVEAQAGRVNDLYLKAAEQLETAKQAIDQAAQVAAQARTELKAAKDFVDRVAQRLAEVAREHLDVSPVAKAHSAATQFIESATRDLARAETKLEERRHLGAYRDTQTAKNQLAQVTEKLNTALDICADLDLERARYQEALAKMEEANEDARRRVRRFAGNVDLIRTFRRPQTTSGPLDYAHLFGMLQQQRQEWNSIARHAEIAYEEEQMQQREAAELERRRRQASLYNSSSSSSSSWGGSSSSSSSSGSSGGSFSSGGSGSSGGSW